MIKKILFSTALIVFVFSCFSVTNAGASFELSETYFNFGKVSQSVTVEHEFWIKSTGDETLILRNIDPGCGCTRAPIQDTIVVPGDSVLLKIYFDTRKYRGHVIKKPSFESNVNDKKTYLKILTEPLPDPFASRPIIINPLRIDVSQFKAKVRRKSKFEIINKSDQDIKMSVVAEPGRFYDIELPSIVKAGDTAVGTVIVKEDSIKKEFQNSFTIEFQDEARTRFTLPVRRLYKVKDES